MTGVSAGDILLVVDVQNDFCPGGALPVPEGDAVIAPINRLARLFPHVVLAQDWHPSGHISFASAHPGRRPFETVDLPYGAQRLWPDHCVQGSPGADFHRDLRIPQAEAVIRKGFRPDMDSYSVFRENDRRTATGMEGYLRERGFGRVFLAGFATDYCCLYSALDARQAGFAVTLIEDACRPIATGDAYLGALNDMRRAGVVILTEAEIAK